jgi:hypothetical protein
MDKFVSDVYTMDPQKVKFDTTISAYNRLQNDAEFEATLASVKKIGQTEPVYMDNGLCIDGRHRVKACIRLGIEVKAIDINSELSMSDKFMLANKDLTSGRDLTKSQLAIQAHKFSISTKTSKSDTAKYFKINRRLLTYVNEIKTHLPEAYDAIYETGKYEIEGKFTSSVERIYKYVNTIKEQGKVVDKAESGIDYEQLITTERGKELFWQLYNVDRRPDPSLAEHLIKYVNLRFELTDEELDAQSDLI